MGKTKRLTVPAAALDNADGPGGEAVVTVPDKKKMPTRVRVQCNECGAVRGSEPPSKILVQFGTDEQGKPRYYEYSRTRIGKTVQYKPADTMEFVRIDSGRVTATGEIVFSGPQLLEEDLRPLTDLELATALAECAERGVGLDQVGFTAEVDESQTDDAQTASTSARTPQRAGTSTEAPSFTTSTPRKDRSYTEPDLQLTVVSNPKKPIERNHDRNPGFCDRRGVTRRFELATLFGFRTRIANSTSSCRPARGTATSCTRGPWSTTSQAGQFQ